MRAPSRGSRSPSRLPASDRRLARVSPRDSRTRRLSAPSDPPERATPARVESRHRHQSSLSRIQADGRTTKYTKHAKAKAESPPSARGGESPKGDRSGNLASPIAARNYLGPFFRVVRVVRGSTALFRLSRVPATRGSRRHPGRPAPRSCARAVPRTGRGPRAGRTSSSPAGRARTFRLPASSSRRADTVPALSRSALLSRMKPERRLGSPTEKASLGAVRGDRPRALNAPKTDSIWSSTLSPASPTTQTMSALRRVPIKPAGTCSGVSAGVSTNSICTSSFDHMPGWGMTVVNG